MARRACSGSEARRCGRRGQRSGRHPYGHAATLFSYLSEKQNIQHFAVRLKFWTSRLQLSTYQQQKRGRGPSGSLPVGGVAAAVCVALKPSFIYVAPLGGSVDLTKCGLITHSTAPLLHVVILPAGAKNSRSVCC